jgi:hypothetical protein
MAGNESAVEQLLSQLQGGGIDAIARQVGIGKEQTAQVVSAAMPALLEGLTRNSKSADGAVSLAGALDRDHDGSVLDDVMGFLGQSSSAGLGAGILGHVFGGKQSSVESALGKMSGVDASSVSRILATLAPLVMGVLGRTKRDQGLDPSGLAGWLGGEREAVQQRAPGAMDMLGGLLDSDGDGDVKDDLMKMGGSLLGGLFGGKR